MSALQIVHVACVVTYLTIAGFVLWRAPMLQRSAGVAAIASCFAWWSGCLLVAHHDGASREVARFAYDLGVVGWASFGSLALAFALAFVGRRDVLARIGVRIALVALPVGFMVAQWRGVLAADYVHAGWGWAYVWSDSPATYAFYAYYGVTVTVAISIVFVAGRRADDPHVRRQAQLIVATALVPLLGATATDVVLPWLGVYAIPNLAPAFLVAWVVGITVAIVRHRLLELTAETAAVDLLAAMSDGVLLVRGDDRIAACNPAASRLLGGGGDLRGRELTRMVPPDAFAVDAASGQVHAIANRLLALSRTSVRGPDGVTLGSLCLIRDVTERTRAERALATAHAELEARVRERTRELDDAVRELQSVVRTLGGLQATIDAIHKSASAREIAQGVARTLAAGLGGQGGCRVILDGERFDSAGLVEVDAPAAVELHAGGKLRGRLELHTPSPPHAAELEALARVGLEIGQTLESLALRHAVAQSDRLASIGVLAAGVAHEINNPLTYLTMGLYEIQDGLERMRDQSAEALRERTGEALHGAERIQKIVRELGTFARDGDDVRRIPIDEAVDAAVAMANHQIRHRARLRVDHASARAVRADLGRLTQVFLNLLVNAAHAIPDGNAEGNEIAIATRDLEDDGIEITVRDTGRGIARDDLAHVFEPFFSTKPTGEGSGLGLSICQKIVRSIGGQITVDSEVGVGTTFRVVLPVASVEAPRPTLAVAAPAHNALAPSVAPGRILLVDDDAPVARAVARVLEPHDVTIVASGAEARRTLEADPAFDVIVCDVMMPDMNGPELHAWLARAHPRLTQRVVFVTGGAFTPATEAFVEAHREDLLLKPLDPDALRHKVEDRLRRGRTS